MTRTTAPAESSKIRMTRVTPVTFPSAGGGFGAGVLTGRAGALTGFAGVLTGFALTSGGGSGGRGGGGGGGSIGRDDGGGSAFRRAPHVGQR
jgi:hypothetical protein